MSDMPQNFFNDSNVSYQVSSSCKVYNLLSMATMSEKNTSEFMVGGGVHPTLLFGVPRKPPSTHLKNEKF